MSICRAHYVKNPNALTLRMSGEQVCLQVPPKLYIVHSWITQIRRSEFQTVGPATEKKPSSPGGVVLNTWNRQLMTSGRSQMMAPGNCGNWHTEVGEIRCSRCRR